MQLRGVRLAWSLVCLLVGSILLAALTPVAANAADTFTDDDGSIFEADIEWSAEVGVAVGCNPPANDQYCPDANVTRGQMAAFLVRALGYTDAGSGDLFVDDDGSTFEADIDKLATAGVTLGCNPPANDRYCPDANVTRGQMAAFLVRALGYTDAGSGDLFVDDDGSLFEGDIDKLARAGVTLGCNPPANDRYCPNSPVTRAQMAAFLHRAIAPDIAPISVNQYLAGLGAWDDFSPLLEAGDGPTGPTIDLSDEAVGGVVYGCEETPYSIAATPEQLVTLEEGGDILWLGALLQGEGYRDGFGSLVELPIRQRAPIGISLSVVIDDRTNNYPFPVYVDHLVASGTVINPTNSSTNAAIEDLVSVAEAGGTSTLGDLVFRKKTTYSLDQAALQIGLHGRYLGSQARADLAYEKSTDEHTVTAYFAEPAFTVSMELPETPAELFTAAFTDDVLAEQQALGTIGSQNPPVFIDSITYGRVLMFTITARADEQVIHSTVRAVYDKWESGTDLSVEQKELLAMAEIGAVSVGSGLSDVEGLIRTGDLSAFFTESPDLKDFEPISYTARNVADNGPAQVSDTTTYDFTSCFAHPVDPSSYVARVTFRKAVLRSFIDGSPLNGWDQDRFFLEVQAYNRTSSGEETPVFENGRGCEYDTNGVLESGRDVLCWDYQLQGLEGQDETHFLVNDAWGASTGDPTSLTVTFDVAGVGDPDFNTLLFRAGSRDYDLVSSNDWCVGTSEVELTKDLLERFESNEPFFFTIGSGLQGCIFDVFVDTELVFP